MSVANDVRAYVQNNPYIKYCISKNIVNYSQLAKHITKKLYKSDSEQKNKAAEVALRRITLPKSSKKEIYTILKQSDIEIKNNITVLIGTLHRKDILTNVQRLSEEKNEPFFFLKDLQLATVLVKSNYKVRLAEAFEDIKVLHEDEIMIKYTSPTDIEETEGFVAHLTQLLAEQGINILEFISTYTNTYIIIEKKDLTKTIQTLHI